MRKDYEEYTGRGLYIHIPFCVSKCPYCDFLSAASDESTRKEYVQALIREISVSSRKEDRKEGTLPGTEKTGEKKVDSVFVGGGTPTVLEGKDLARILETVCSCYDLSPDAEVTVECNPGTVKPDTFRMLRSAGCTRLSFGVQSASPRILTMLGRIHSWQDFLEAFRAARSSGFDNINADLMYAVPGQSLEEWTQTLRRCGGLGLEHLSAYSLIIEEGTPFYARYHRDLRRREQGEKPLLLPDEQLVCRMDQAAAEILQEYGLAHYEISNYARPGFESIHNTGCWLRREYRGFGLGAASFEQGCRWTNTRSLSAYLRGDCKADAAEYRKLTVQEQIEETMFLGLRLLRGIDLERFYGKFGMSVDAVYGDIPKRLEQQGLLERSEGRLKLTHRGLEIGNYVMGSFLMETE